MIGKRDNYISFFDVLISRTAGSRVPGDRNLVASIKTNLDRLFNTPRGSVRHLDDYGLPHLSEVGRTLTEEMFVHEAEEAVKKYEPRLREESVRIVVRKLPTGEKTVDKDHSQYREHLVLDLYGDYLDEDNNAHKAHFTTTLSSFDGARVHPETPR